jgi:hypothetical protein
VEEQNMTDHDVRGMLLAGSDDVPPEIDLLRGVREGRTRARRQGRRRTRALVSTAVVAGGAAAAAALLATSVSDTPSAFAAVTSAVAKTSAESYHFSLSGKTEYMGPRVHAVQLASITGAFDPGRKRGAESLTTHLRAGRAAPSPVRAQMRFIGKYLYTWVSPGSGMGSMGKPWDKAPIPPPGVDTFAGDDLRGFSAERPVSPAELLGALQSSATVRDEGPASGPGWTGTKYAFTARPARQPVISGTVYVDQQGRVRRLVTTTSRYLSTSPSQPVLTTVIDLTFGDFGAPVPVTAPPASEVGYTTTPFWSFGGLFGS